MKIGSEQIIRNTRRETAETKSIIDLCYTNRGEQRIKGEVLYTAITDHYATNIIIEKQETFFEKKERESNE